MKDKIIAELNIKIMNEKDATKLEQMKIKRMEVLRCNCGAYYTGNPFHHYDWCNSQVNSENVNTAFNLLDAYKYIKRES